MKTSTTELVIEMTVQEGAVLAGLLSNLVKYVGLDDKGVTANNCSFYIKKLDDAANEYELNRKKLAEEQAKKNAESLSPISPEEQKKREELRAQIDLEAKEALESKAE